MKFDMKKSQLFLIALIFIPFAFAQEKPTSHTLRAAALAVIESHETLWLRTGAGHEALEISLNTRTFSTPITYKGSSPAVFYASAVEAAAENPPAPLASVKLNGNSTLLVFAPAKNEKTYAIYPIAEEKFPSGSFYFVNLSSFSLNAEIGKNKFLLPTGKAKTISFPDGQRNIPVRIQTKDQENKTRLLRQSYWSLSSTQRELILFLPSPHNNYVKMRHFVDSENLP